MEDPTQLWTGTGRSRHKIRSAEAKVAKRAEKELASVKEVKLAKLAKF